jgi:hypothetical protein
VASAKYSVSAECTAETFGRSHFRSDTSRCISGRRLGEAQMNSTKNSSLAKLNLTCKISSKIIRHLVKVRSQIFVLFVETGTLKIVIKYKTKC